LEASRGASILSTGRDRMAILMETEPVPLREDSKGVIRGPSCSARRRCWPPSVKPADDQVFEKEALNSFAK